ncbi:MAG: HAD family hydrolase [Planctomycetota bacterium]|nr:HAD family hydrolase [Planctomycetota bacterium]MDA1105959.1 HAD family hydrolase [Planctomycetota bacterium]
MAQGHELELTAGAWESPARGTAVFDVDGTLTQTHELDEAWYRIAIAEVLGVNDFSTDWASYRHSSDRAIVREIGERHRGREATPEEGERVLDRYASLLEGAAARGLIQPVAGAQGVLGALQAQGWTVAIATGGWGRTARLKLRAAGIECEGVAFASADDADPREDIIELALRRAVHARRALVVYVGDGCWDKVAADRLGCGFLGIGTGERAAELVAAGAKTVLDGYRDHVALGRLLVGAGRSLAGWASCGTPART